MYAQNGWIYGIDDLVHINLEKSYWDRSLNDDLMVANARFFATGAFNLTAYDFTHILLFNKQLVRDLGLADPYRQRGEHRARLDALQPFDADVLNHERRRYCVGNDSMCVDRRGRKRFWNQAMRSKQRASPVCIAASDQAARPRTPPDIFKNGLTEPDR